MVNQAVFHYYCNNNNVTLLFLLFYNISGESNTRDISIVYLPYIVHVIASGPSLVALNTSLSKFIVLAPVYPSNWICHTYATEGYVKCFFMHSLLVKCR